MYIKKTKTNQNDKNKRRMCLNSAQRWIWDVKCLLSGWSDTWSWSTKKNTTALTSIHTTASRVSKCVCVCGHLKKAITAARHEQHESNRIISSVFITAVMQLCSDPVTRTHTWDPKQLQITAFCLSIYSIFNF